MFLGTTVSGPIQQRQPSLVQSSQEKPLITTPRPVAYNIYSGTQTFTKASRQSLEQDMVAENRIVQWGSFPQPTVPPSGKQGNGSYFVVQAGAAGHGKQTTGQQPSTQVVQQEISSVAPTQKNSLDISSAATQCLVNQVPATTLVQLQADLKDKTAKWESPSEQNLPTAVPQGKQKLHVTYNELV